MMKDEIVLYRPDQLASHIEVRLEDDTVWLNRNQISVLFDRDVKTIGKHINNVFSEGELDEISTVAKFATVQNEGSRQVERQVEHYNLDVIISVGYRVKSKQGTQFRIWATRVLKDYLLKGYAINNRMNRLEDNFESLKSKVNQIDLQINSHLIPTQGVFFEGQVFDAYKLASSIIRSAQKNIVLIDNYIDENTLTHLSKKNQGVKVLLLTKTISKQILLDVQKANAQFGDFELQTFTQSHDRFIIIDQKEVYHLGASLKDLGRKWFGFSRLEPKSVEGIIDEVKKMM
jgi:hypothetical protein